ncbi:MAG TPA: PAS domain S-box protein [Bryobacteraceae bacterium]|jgi:PAS domain S-box-containing protein
MVELESLRSLAAHLPAGLFTIDSSGRCVYVNAKALELCGVDQENLVGQPWAQAFKIEAADLVMASWSAGASTVYKGVFRAYRAGLPCWIEVRTAPIATGEKELSGHAGIILETMDAWDMERRIATRDAVTHILADSATIEGARQRLLAEVGVILGWRVGVFWQPDEPARSLRPVTLWAASPAVSIEALTSNRTFPAGIGLPGRVWSSREPAWITDIALDTNFPRRQGALQAGFHGAFAFPILLGGEIFGVIEFFTNEVWGPDADLLELVGVIGSQIGQFIDRKRKEASLRQSEERLQLIANHIGEVLWIIDPMQRSLVYVSPSFEAIWGRPAESVLQGAESFLETVHSDDRSCARAFVDRIFSGKETDEEFRIIRPDGTIRWIRDLAFPVRNERGDLEHVVGLAVDITDRREQEQQRARAEKAEAIAALAGGLAHDLNNLLTGVLGNTTIAIDMLGEYHPATWRLRNTLSAGERAAAIVSQILAYAGKGRFIDRLVNLSETVSEFVKAIRASVPRNIRLETHLREDLPLIRADPNQIRQLIGNLYLNAVEAIGETDGIVTILTDLERIKERRGESADVLPPGDYICLKVIDTGCGIDEQARTRIFDPFFSTKFVGRGLGLAAAQGIIRAHGGAIRVASQPGLGSTFTCLLPVNGALE